MDLMEALSKLVDSVTSGVTDSVQKKKDKEQKEKDTPTRAEPAAKKCKKGKLCGMTCIAKYKKCHKKSRKMAVASLALISMEASGSIVRCTCPTMRARAHAQLSWGKAISVLRARSPLLTQQCVLFVCIVLGESPVCVAGQQSNDSATVRERLAYFAKQARALVLCRSRSNTGKPCSEASCL